MSWLFMVIPEFYNDVGNDMFYYFTRTNQLCHILCPHDCKIWLLFMFLFIRYVAARIYKNLSGDLSRCYVDRTGGRIASYSALPHPTLVQY